MKTSHKLRNILFAATIFLAARSHATPGDITTVVGTGMAGATSEGALATESIISIPYYMAVDSDGNYYTTGIENPFYRTDSTTGLLFRFGGLASAGFEGDGDVAINAKMNQSSGLALDRLGNIYIADKNNHRIRKVDGETKVITTIAGTGAMGHSGDEGPALEAELNTPTSLAVDADGNVYFTDDDRTRIRCISSATGIITTIGGDGMNGYAGDDGPAVDARFNEIRGICIDHQGNVIIADGTNHRIRKINLDTGIVSTIAGKGLIGPVTENIDALGARFYYPSGVAVDGVGNLFIADYTHDCIRRVDAVTNIITTIAGTTVGGYSGDDGPATEAEINAPFNLAIDARGNLYIMDTVNRRIRMVESAGEPVQFQPDNTIGKSLNRQRGTNLFNRSASGQSQTIRSRKPKTKFYFKVLDQTETVFSDKTKVRATKGNRKVKARYFLTGNGNVTAAVVRGNLQLDTSSSSRISAFKAQIKAGKKKGRKSRTFRVTSGSLQNPNGFDAVRAKVLIK